MTPRASDSRKRSCAYHPGIVADTACERCGRLFCAECIKSWNGKDLGPLCRRERVRRRVVIGLVLAVMLAAPAAVIVWGYDQHRRYGSARHRVRARQKMLQRFPHSAGIRLRLAQDLLRASRPNQARAELDRLLKDHPNHLGGLLTRSRLATTQRDHPGALRYAIRALLSTPRSRPARLAVARAYLVLDRPDKAEATLRAGLKKDPRALSLTLELVTLLKKQKRTTEAVGLLRQAQQHARSHASRKSLQRRIDQLTQPNK